MARWRDQQKYAPEIHAAAKAHGLRPAFLWAIVAKESAFNPRAFRREPKIGDASYGLGQLLYGTAKTMGFRGQPDELFEVPTNLQYAAKYLASRLRLAGNEDGAASAYNGGWKPRLGFGRPATEPVTVCLARDQTTGDCIRRRNVRAGEFANQTYVNLVREYAGYFEALDGGGPG